MPALRHATPRIAAIAFLCATLSACDLAFSSFSEQASETLKKTYPLSAGGRVEIANTNGFVHVEVGGDQVEVTAEKIGRGNTQEAAKEALKLIEVKEDVSADRVRLETRRAGGGGFGRGGFEVRYTVRVPAAAKVEVQTTNGEVKVAGVKSGARMSTTNGSIDGRDLSGEVRATTTNGQVDLNLASLTDPLHVSTTNGAVDVTIPSDSKGELNASVTNGAIDVSGLELEVEGERTRRRLNGKLNGGGPRIDLSTTNGAISVSGRSR